MLAKKKWTLVNNFQFPISRRRQGYGGQANFQFQIDQLINILLENRGIRTNEERRHFLHPKLEDVTVDAVGIDTKQLTKALKRIKKAIDEKEQIVVFGDYDVDGITGTAILWETLYGLGASVVPYIPGRIEEGYGLSMAGISNFQFQISNVKLIITVDNGIVAHEAVEFANEQGIDVIITDHHARSEKDPDAYAIIHTTKLCGAGVAYLLSQECQMSNVKYQMSNKEKTHLDLVALATVADLVPLTGANRTLVKFGLESLRHTKRIGLHALFSEAGIEQSNIGVYEIGHIIGPRLNAMGRMASAMDSLRLLCTKDPGRALRLAETLGRTNRERQLLTQEMTTHAIERFKINDVRFKNLIFIADATYEQGVIGLVASKLVETFYRPAIVLAKGETHSKASARSISGFNIIEFIRSHEALLVNAGGHPMAAGFTVETHRLEELQSAMETLALEHLTEDLLTRSLKIDCELPIEVVNQQLYDTIQQLAPFGMGNSEPVFVSRNVVVDDIRAIGAMKNHLKLELRITNHESRIEAVAFGFGELINEIKVGDTIDIAYVVDENEWRGNKKLQLKVKDIQLKNVK